MADNSPTPHTVRHKLIRLGVAALAGLVVALLIPTPKDVAPAARVLVGFVITALGFALPIVRAILRADQSTTRDYVEGLDPGRSAVDIVVVLGTLGSLAGVGFMLLGKGTDPSAKIFEGITALLTVGSGWFLVHTMFAMRYARHWFNAESDCVDFHMKDAPCYSDFLYLAFALGASFAVSDTDLQTTAIRRIAMKHSWLSYLLGTVLVGATINLIAGMAA